ncbi:MAG: hypothetical protein WC509_00205 [Candidatus Izemoplasmatales bacterium]
MKRRFLVLILTLSALAGCTSITTQSTSSTVSTSTTVSTVTTTATTTTGTTTAEATTATVTTVTLAPLDAPSDLYMNAQELLSWTPVSETATYVLEIDGVEIAVDGTSYDMSSYPDSAYGIRIRAVDGVRRSDYSEMFDFFILNHPTVPFDVRVDGLTLRWNQTENAVGYRVTVNGIDTDVPYSSFDLNPLQVNAVYLITVSSLYGNGIVSDPSLPVYYHTYLNVLGEAEASFDKSAPFDVVLDLSEETGTVEEIWYAGCPMPDSDERLDGNVITFPASFLDTFDYGEYEYLVLTTEGSFAFSLSVVDDRAPYMVSSGQIVFSGADIVLEFEVYDGFVEGVSGNDIVAADYLIDGTRVVISAAYVQNKFAMEPDRTALILGITLRANDDVTLAFVFIRLPQPSA